MLAYYIYIYIYITYQFTIYTIILIYVHIYKCFTVFNSLLDHGFNSPELKRVFALVLYRAISFELINT